MQPEAVQNSMEDFLCSFFLCPEITPYPGREKLSGGCALAREEGVLMRPCPMRIFRRRNSLFFGLTKVG